MARRRSKRKRPSASSRAPAKAHANNKSQKSQQVAPKQDAPENSRKPEAKVDLGPTAVVTPKAPEEKLSAKTPDIDLAKQPVGDEAAKAPQTDKFAADAARPKSTPENRAAGFRQALQPETLLSSDYRILDVLSSDGVSVAYKAHDMNLGVAVQIKEYFPVEYAFRAKDGTLEAKSNEDEENYAWARDRFLREARTLVRFRHPNVLHVRRVFEDNNTAYIVFDYEHGQTFEAWLADLARPPKQSELDRIVSPLLDALSVVHSSDFLHRDIRPENIFIRNNGAPVLINFGAARQAIGSRSRVLSTVMGSNYAAPEDVAEDLANHGPWTDIYAMAATLYRAITGNAPADGAMRLVKDTVTAVTDRIEGDYRKEFLQAIDKAMAVSANERPQSIANWDGIRKPQTILKTVPKIEDEKTLIKDDATVVHTRPQDPVETQKTGTVSLGNAKTRLQAFSALATQYVPEVSAEQVYPETAPLPLEQWFVPGAFMSAILGMVLFATGWDFALAAIFQVLATVLFFLNGLLPLNRFLSHVGGTAQTIETRCERATRTAAAMTVFLFAMVAFNALFTNSLVPAELTDVKALALVLAVPMFLMGLYAAIGTPVRGWVRNLSFGFINILVLLFTIFMLGANFYVNVVQGSSNVHPAQLVNRYMLSLSNGAVVVLCGLIFICRFSAKQRLKQVITKH